MGGAYFSTKFATNAEYDRHFEYLLRQRYGVVRTMNIFTPRFGVSFQVFALMPRVAIMARIPRTGTHTKRQTKTRPNISAAKVIDDWKNAHPHPPSLPGKMLSGFRITHS